MLHFHPGQKCRPNRVLFPLPRNETSDYQALFRLIFCLNRPNVKKGGASNYQSSAEAIAKHLKNWLTEKHK